jgi:mRNA-degrading endonuclease YafQ of YafQ-DinJ toxin-antitoxin module
MRTLVRTSQFKNDFKRLECHLAGDWLLIYRITLDELVLVRTGSHTELFD